MKTKLACIQEFQESHITKHFERELVRTTESGSTDSAALDHMLKEESLSNVKALLDHTFEAK